MQARSLLVLALLVGAFLVSLLSVSFPILVELGLSLPVLEALEAPVGYVLKVEAQVVVFL